MKIMKALTILLSLLARTIRPQQIGTSPLVIINDTELPGWIIDPSGEHCQGIPLPQKSTSTYANIIDKFCNDRPRTNTTVFNFALCLDRFDGGSFATLQYAPIDQDGDYALTNFTAVKDPNFPGITNKNNTITIETCEKYKNNYDCGYPISPSPRR